MNTKFKKWSYSKRTDPTKKVDIPYLYDMIHGERQEIVDAMMRLTAHEKVHEVFCKVMKDRTPGKQMINIVHPDWLKSGLKEDFDAIRNFNMSYEEMVACATVAINDHVCPSCKNDRVSKTETSCWKCGGLL